MSAIAVAKLLITESPELESSKILEGLLDALEVPGTNFELSKLYTLDYENLSIALAVLSEWRIICHYRSISSNYL